RLHIQAQAVFVGAAFGARGVFDQGDDAHTGPSRPVFLLCFQYTAQTPPGQGKTFPLDRVGGKSWVNFQKISRICSWFSSGLQRKSMVRSKYEVRRSYRAGVRILYKNGGGIVRGTAAVCCIGIQADSGIKGGA